MNLVGWLTGIVLVIFSVAMTKLLTEATLVRFMWHSVLYILYHSGEDTMDGLCYLELII